MKSRAIFFSVVFILIVLPGFAQEQKRIALGDLNVTASQASYKAVGKGITELIAVELVKSKAVSLVEREKRFELMKEMEFGLSDAAESSKAAQLGMLLQADYLGFGEAIEMGPKFLISMKLVKVESGEVVWADKLMEALTNYDYIAAFFSSSILKAMAAPVAATTVAKVEQKVEKNEQALVAFSRAVEAVDRKEVATAKQELQVARQFDPASEAVAFYIAKLSGASPRMQVEIDLTAASFNPALAALLDKPRLYSWYSSTADMSSTSRIQFGNLEFTERFMTIRFGILFPIMKSFGLMAEIIPMTQLNSGIGSIDHTPVFTNYPGGSGNLDRSSFAGLLGLSWRMLPELSVGASFRLGKYFQSELGVFSDPWIGQDGPQGGYWYGILPGQSLFSLTVEGGAMYKSADDILNADLRVLYSPDTDGYVDVAAKLLQTGTMPLTLSLGGSLGLLKRTLFLAGRAITEIYFDSRSGYMLRLVPAAEWWPFAFIGLRAGYEYSMLSLLGSTASGHGGMGGVSLKLHGFGLDFNYTYRYRPYRHLPGYGYSESFFLIGLSYEF
jgi:TolB-like protein